MEFSLQALIWAALLLGMIYFALSSNPAACQLSRRRADRRRAIRMGRAPAIDPQRIARTEYTRKT
jgi:hypothetical protein